MENFNNHSLHETAKSTEDVLLKCGKELLPAKQSKLSSISPYFQSMFASDWEETRTGLVNLPTISGDVMKVLLDCAFAVRKDLSGVNDSEDFILELTAASHLMQIYTVFDLCITQLEERLTLDNFCTLYGLSELYNNQRLKLCVETFMAKNIKDVVKCAEFLRLTKEHLCAAYLNSVFDKSSTDHIIRGLLTWGRFFDNEPQFHTSKADVLDMLTETIDLSHMSSDYLIALLKDKHFLAGNPQVTTLFMAEMLTRSLTVVQRSPEYSNATKLFCFGKNNERQIIRIYDIDSNIWSSGQDLPFDLEYGMAVIGHDSHIFFFGRGEVDRVIPSKTVLKYCPETNTATTTGSLMYPVFMAQAGIVYESIYLIGGMNRNKQVVKTVQRYSPSTGFCQEVASTNKKHSWPYAFAFQHHLYIASCKNNSTKNMERYDVLTDQWTMMTNIPGSFRAAISGSKLFSIQKTVDTEFKVYNVASEERTVVRFTDGPYEIFELWAAKKRGRPVLLARDRENVIHWFDVQTCQWDTTMVPNNIPWHGWQTCTL